MSIWPRKASVPHFANGPMVRTVDQEVVREQFYMQTPTTGPTGVLRFVGGDHCTCRE
jgi:hypothetical protein